MRKAFVVVVAALALSTFIVGCPGKQVKQEGPEILYPGEFVESVDANIDLVKCRGKGETLEMAIDHARRGCLEWMITDKLAQSPGERKAYMDNQKAIMAKVDRYIPPIKPGARSGKGEGVKSRTRDGDGYVNVEINIKVYKKPLMADLVAMNIIQSKDEMLAGAGAGSKPTLTVVPFPASKGNKNRGMMEGLLLSYLTKQKWEVMSPSAVQDLDKLVDAIGEVAGAEEDEAAQIAQAVGADIYIKFEAEKNKGKGMAGGQIAYTVRVEACETTSGRALASQKVTSPAKYELKAGEEQRVYEEALSDAMAQVLPQITDYWKEDRAKGRHFYIAFKNAPKKTDMRMSSVLKKACTEVKLKTSTASTAIFQAQCKLDNLELAGAIDEGITAKMGGADYDFAAKTGTTLIVVFK